MPVEPIDLSEARRSILPRLKSRSQGFARRSFKAGNVTRLTRDWPITPQNINQILKAQGQNLRARARYQACNDPYASNFVKMVKRNVVGHAGVTMQAKVKAQRGGKLNEPLNTALEQMWTTFGLPKNCTTKRTTSLVALDQFLIGMLPADGEFFVQRVIDKTSPLGIRVRTIDPDQLDSGYNTTAPLPNGNTVVMGVELDSEMAPVAYHFRKPWATGQRVAVPATDIIHYFIPLFSNQVRGFPWMAPSMYRLNMLSEYEDAEATAARQGATKAGFYYNEKGATDYRGETDKLDENSFVDEIEPGQWEILPEGWKAQSYDPQHPNAAYPAFMKTALRAVSAGYGVDYNTLANDLEGVNFSSMRAGLLEVRDEWKLLQAHFVAHYKQPLFSWVLEAADLKGAISLGKFTRDVVESSIVWTPRRWAWVDPTKDVGAAILERENCLNTITAQLAEKGMDFEETVDQIAYEQEYLKAKDVKIGGDLKGDTTGTGIAEEGDEGGDANGGKSNDAGKQGAGK